MFVRWQSRKHLNSDYYGASWSAILVEAKRVNGRPRQQHVAYLGSITAKRLEIIAQRCHFWDEICERLDELGGRISAARPKIEEAIAKKVPRPNSDEYREIARRSAGKFGWDLLSAHQKKALHDEAERWKTHAVQAPRACYYCSNAVPGHALAMLFNGKPGHVCDECLVAALQAFKNTTA